MGLVFRSVLSAHLSSKKGSKKMGKSYDEAWKTNRVVVTRIAEARELFRNIKETYEVEKNIVPKPTQDLYKSILEQEASFEKNAEIIEELVLPLLLFASDSNANKVVGEHKTKISAATLNNIAKNINEFMKCLNSIQLSYNRLVAPIINDVKYPTFMEYVEKIKSDIIDNLKVKESLNKLYKDISNQKKYKKYSDSLTSYREEKKYIDILEKDLNTNTRVVQASLREKKDINKYIVEIVSYGKSEEMKRRLANIDRVLNNYKDSFMFEESERARYQQLLSKRREMFCGVNVLLANMQKQLGTLNNRVLYYNKAISFDENLIRCLKNHDTIGNDVKSKIVLLEKENDIHLGKDNPDYVYAKNKNLITWLAHLEGLEYMYLDRDQKPNFRSRYEYFANSHKAIVEQRIKECSSDLNAEKYIGDEAFIDLDIEKRIKENYGIKCKCNEAYDPKKYNEYILKNFMSDGPMENYSLYTETVYDEKELSEDQKQKLKDVHNYKSDPKFNLKYRIEFENQEVDKLFNKCIVDVGGNPKETLDDDKRKKALDLFRRERFNQIKKDKNKEIGKWLDDALHNEEQQKSDLEECIKGFEAVKDLDRELVEDVIENLKDKYDISGSIIVHSELQEKRLKTAKELYKDLVKLHGDKIANVPYSKNVTNRKRSLSSVGESLDESERKRICLARLAKFGQ